MGLVASAQQIDTRTHLPGPALAAPAAVLPPQPLLHPVAVVQPLPGIGDMIWHVPHIRAIAAFAGNAVTLIAKPRSLADQLLAEDPAVADIFWVDINPAGRRGAHDGARGFMRLVRKLKSYEFGTVIMLHHSTLLAAAIRLAGVPDRRGYGWGRQRLFLNEGPFLPPEVAKLHQHTRATRYLQAAGIPMPTEEPHVAVSAAAIEESRSRLGGTGARFVAVGIGSSEILRQWGPERFANVVQVLLDAGWDKVVLVGGQEDTRMASFITGMLGDRARRVQMALGWHLRDVGGMLAQADFYIGNNTGVMNLAAAIGIRTYALFGTTQPFDHASQIVPICSPDEGVHDGMVRLTTDAALAVILADRGRLSP